MTDLWKKLQFALRERRGVLGVWLVLGAVATVAGPFGTFEALPPLGRGLYWFAVVGLSVLFSPVVSRVASGRDRPVQFAIRAGAVLVLATAVHLLNAALFEHWAGVWRWAYLAFIVGLVTCAVHVVVALALRNDPSQPDPVQSFQRRLPVGLRGPLVRIEAQDHYLNVVTARGSGLILMRLGDAVAELPADEGLRVHRSHWVQRGAVRDHLREGGRDMLVMADGARVPVSRSYRPAAREAGLI